MNGNPGDRIEHQLSDTVSVASTVKVSNVASNEPRNYSPHGSKIERRNRNDESDLRIAPTLSSTEVNGANTGMAKCYQKQHKIHAEQHLTQHSPLFLETFLLRMLESLSRNDLERVLEDTMFIGRSIHEMRLIWNDLTPEHYQILIRSFFEHLRVEKRNHGHMRRLFRPCLNGLVRPAATKTINVEQTHVPCDKNKKTVLEKTSLHPLVALPTETIMENERDAPVEPGDKGRGSASVASV